MGLSEEKITETTSRTGDNFLCLKEDSVTGYLGLSPQKTGQGGPRPTEANS